MKPQKLDPQLLAYIKMMHNNHKKQMASGGDILGDIGLGALNIVGAPVSMFTGESVSGSLGLRASTNLGKDVQKLQGKQAAVSAGLAPAAAGIAGTIVGGPMAGKAASAAVSGIQGATLSDEAKRSKEYQMANAIGSPVTSIASMSIPGMGAGATPPVDPNAAATAADLTAQQIEYANGGMLQEYNAGGTHQQNPMGGIPVGSSASVEQGETKASLLDGEFIFSDRIKRSKSDKSFADLSKAIKKRFKDREGDAQANRAMQQQLEGLAQEQEAIKAAKMSKMQSSMEALNATGEGAMMAMGGKLKQYGRGGPLHARAMKGYTLPEQLAGENLYNFQKEYGVTPDGVYGPASEKAYNDFLAKQNGEQALAFNQASGTTIDMATKPIQGFSAAPIVAAIPATNKPNFAAAEQSVAKDIVTDPTNDNAPNWLDVAGTTANMAGDIYNLAQGMRGPDNISLDRLSPELVDLSRERQIARNNAASAVMTNRENVRNFAPSSGALLAATAAGTTAIHSNLGNQLSQSAQNEETANVGIKNAAQQGNTELANKEKLLNLQAKAKAQEAIQAGLTGIGSKTAVGIRDYKLDKTQDKQNQRALNILGNMSKDFQWDTDGNLTFKKSDGSTGKYTADQVKAIEEYKKSQEGK